MEGQEIQTQQQFNTEWIVTLVLWFFLGGLWIHRFYNWKVGTGILMILTLGWFGIWWLIDGIMIVLSKFTNAENKFVKIKV